MLTELHGERSFKNLSLRAEKFVTASEAWQSMNPNLQPWVAALRSQRRSSLGRAEQALKRLNAGCAVSFTLRHHVWFKTLFT